MGSGSNLSVAPFSLASKQAPKISLLDSEEDTLQTLFLLAVLLLGFNGLWSMRRLLVFHPERIYQSESIFLASITYIPYLLVLVVPLSMLLLGWRQLKWSEFEYRQEFRVLVFVAAFPVVWSFLTAEYNPFFDQAYHLDRLVLAGIYLLVWVHPGFAFLLAAFIFTFEAQFIKPLGHLSTTNSQLPKQVLVLFVSFLFLQLRHVEPLRGILCRLGFKEFYGQETNDERVFIWAMVALVGASYFNAGLNKLLALWPFRENLAYFLPFTYGRGWLAHLEPATISRGFDLLTTLNPLMTWGTVVIEVAGVALLWRKRIFPWIVAGFIALHLLILSVTGILFKMWILFLIAFVWFVHRVDKRAEQSLFRKRSVVIVTVVILLSSAIMPLSSLVWFQTNYDRTYTVEVVADDGDHYPIGWAHMTPYARTFQQNRITYIDEGPTLDGRRSTKDNDVRQRLLSATAPAEIRQMRDRYGTVDYDPDRAAAFDRFLRKYFHTRLCKGKTRTAWEFLPSLPHKFWNSPHRLPPPNESYTAVAVRRTTRLYTDGNIQTVDSNIIRSISLDRDSCEDDME